MTEPLAYLNHEFIPYSQAHLKVYDAGVVLGATVTEMVRTFNQQLFRLDAHLDRLERSLRYVRFDLGVDRAKFQEQLEELVKHNASLLEPAEELGLIAFVTAGEYRTYAGSSGAAAQATPTVCAHTFSLPCELWATGMQNGTHVVTPAIRHVPPQCYDPKMKYRSRMHYYLAEQEARQVDPAAIPLLLDLDGNVTETSGANFLIVEKGQVVSPPLRNILPGISRQTIIDLSAELQIPFTERDFQVYNVINADEAFVCSTPYCMMPVTQINGVLIGDGQPGPVFQSILQGWSKHVELDIPAHIEQQASRRRAQAQSAPVA